MVLVVLAKGVTPMYKRFSTTIRKRKAFEQRVVNHPLFEDALREAFTKFLKTETFSDCIRDAFIEHFDTVEISSDRVDGLSGAIADALGRATMRIELQEEA